MSAAISIVGMACCFPDAKGPAELWENVLSQRRAFRRLPPERLRIEDYYSSDVGTPDATYASEVAVIEGYEFDRSRFSVAGPVFRCVDLTHWLALDVADQALKNAGFPGGRGLPLETTGVIVGNTLTGEFSRASTLRLRWPYVRRVLEARLRAEGWAPSRCSGFLNQLEEEFKAPFPKVGEETLAGSMSNTIAGRICNHFHLGGGGYTVDGACSASLLGVARACSALEAGEIDVALSGGVDLSLDPFELVGFAKAGALAHGEMRVYDKQSSGFLPGEGCGFVVLMRQRDAMAQHLRSYAVIRGWGISSDGGGGITRPEVRGQTLALERAYRCANFEIGSVALFEGHGTGTPVGDQVELTTLSAVRAAERIRTRPAAIGSIKANFGHTKAAAGIAGLIKATLAVKHQLLPPTTGVREPRPEVDGHGTLLRVLREAEPWPEDMPHRAGISSFGFGGINVHVAIEGCQTDYRSELTAREKLMVSSPQDAELFVFDGSVPEQLVRKVARLANLAPHLSYSELADIATVLAGESDHGRVRAAIVAATPRELAERLDKLQSILRTDSLNHLGGDENVFVGTSNQALRIGLLFPGQASPVRLKPGIFGRRFPEIEELYRSTTLSERDDGNSAEMAQVAIIAAELAGLRLLERFGIEASFAVGHSLGELSAYRWAGAISENELLEIVHLRGRLMARLPVPRGTMASIGASASEIQSLIQDGENVVVACLNSTHQTVVSGESEAVASLLLRTRRHGWTTTPLSTGNAFHSPLMSAAAEPFKRGLSPFNFKPLCKSVISTITGTKLGDRTALKDLLIAQLTAPVRFSQAIAETEQLVDLFIEVGPGSVLTHLVKAACRVPSVSLDVSGLSLVGPLRAIGIAYVLGANVNLEILTKRFSRPFDLRRRPKFFANPCELAPVVSGPDAEPTPEPCEKSRNILGTSSCPETLNAASGNQRSSVNVIRTLVAQKLELSPDSINETARLSQDLHLSSIAAGEIVTSAARELKVRPPADVLPFTDNTITGLASALEQLGLEGATEAPRDMIPSGIDNWYRAFRTVWKPHRLQASGGHNTAPGKWKIFGPSNHPLIPELAASSLPGNGVIVCLSEASVEEQVHFLLDATHEAIRMEGERHFAVFSRACLVGAFARTLRLEHPEISTHVLELPLGSDVVRYLQLELAQTQRHTEALYDLDGQRYEQNLMLVEPLNGDGIPIAKGEVVLVSGGAKGIAADCAEALAADTGSRLVLLGRTTESVPHISAHLRALDAKGIFATYMQIDVTDTRSVQRAVESAEKAYGPIAGIVHAAGQNEPALLGDLSKTKILDTLAPKMKGVWNLITAVAPERLRLLVTFGSVLGRVGMRGEAHYALANACMSDATEEFARLHPNCRCIAFETSAWSGAGMAERLGKVEALRRAGIVPLPRAEGVAWFRNLVASRLPGPAIIVSGRLGATSPIPIDGPSLPLLRFVERPRVHYPGVELVVETDLTLGSDPYLHDHVFQGNPILPAVIGLEAMVQVAMAVRGDERIPVIENLRFERPITIEGNSVTTLRIVALVREGGRVDLAIRSSKTSFQIDHFLCSCNFTDGSVAHNRVLAPLDDDSQLPVDPQKDLYGTLLFQGPRFQRLSFYRRISARFSSAVIAPVEPQDWFGPFLPGKFTLGDPAARDAALHSIQACVPDSILLPFSVDRIFLSPLNCREPLTANAMEQWQEGSDYCYDLALSSSDGSVRECWQGLRLRRVGDASGRKDWPDPLVAAHLEWQVRRAVPSARVFAALERDGNAGRHQRTERAIQRALDAPFRLRWKPDGRPEVGGPFVVSSAHCDGLTFSVAAADRVACDIELVSERSQDTWRDLLGQQRWALAQLIAAQMHEDLHTAATRVWTAMESLVKAGVPHEVPLVLAAPSTDGNRVVCMGVPGLMISTALVHLQRQPTPVVIAILVRNDVCATMSTGTESVLRNQTS
jgi:enediyne polyketide synthase